MDIAQWILDNGADLQVVLFFSILPLLILLERLVPKRLTDMERARRWSTNFLLTAVNLVALALLPLSMIGAALWAAGNEIGLLHRLSLPPAVVVLVTLLVRGFISFFNHLLMHKVPALWRIHRVHHLDTELDVSSTVRFHPLEFVVGALLGIPVVVVFGLEPWVLLFYELLDVSVTLWSHSNVRLPGRLERIVHYLVVTPDLHRVHHSSWQPETDSNFGAVFPVWDLIFRTFRAQPRDGHETMQLGLDEVRSPQAHRPLWLLGRALTDPIGPPDGREQRARSAETVVER